jgi:L-alanine-DL-glutamate epimerase-like enolase superfamily enzyme
MKIISVETLRLKEFGNLIWVKLKTNEGLEGLGETFMWPAPVEAHIHETVAPYLLGKNPLLIDAHWRQLYGYLGSRSSGAEMRALSAIDIALWDLWGQATGQPIHQLLGGKVRDEIRTYNTCAGYKYIRSAEGQSTRNFGLPSGAARGPYEDLEGFLTRADELAHSLLEQGITAMKIWPFDFAAEASAGTYISPADLRGALEPFERIRKAVGDRMDIMVECHMLWNVPTAIHISRALEDYRPFWIEDPIKMDSLSNLAEFRHRTRVPVTASESLATRWGFKDLLELRACDFVMPDLGWVGGLSEARKIASMAEAYGLPIAPHDCTGPVVLTASTHLSLNAPNAVLQESVRALYTGWYTEVATNLPSVKDGYITVPDGRGLGMKLLPDLEARPDAIHRVSSLP